MTRSLKSFSVAAGLQATLQNLLVDEATYVAAAQGAAYSPATALSSGTAANKADRIWTSLARALASGGNESIDLYDFGSLDIGGGAGRDAVGQLITLAEIVAILIQNNASSAGGLIIGGEGSGAAWNSGFGGSDSAVTPTIAPGGWWQLFTPADPALVVTDTTNHLLKIAATGGAVTYDIHILGRSA